VSGPFDTIISADVMYLLPLGKWSAVLARFTTCYGRRAADHQNGPQEKQLEAPLGLFTRTNCRTRVTHHEQQESEFTYLTASEWRKFWSAMAFRSINFAKSYLALTTTPSLSAPPVVEPKALGGKFLAARPIAIKKTLLN
jgi:hypothetical protein